MDSASDSQGVKCKKRVQSRFGLIIRIGIFFVLPDGFVYLFENGGRMRFIKTIAIIISIVMFCETAIADPFLASRINLSCASGSQQKFREQTESVLRHSLNMRARLWHLVKGKMCSHSIKETAKRLRAKDAFLFFGRSASGEDSSYIKVLRRSWVHVKKSTKKAARKFTSQTVSPTNKKILLSICIAVIAGLSFFSTNASASQFLNIDTVQPKVKVERYTQKSLHKFPVSIEGHKKRMHDDTLDGISAAYLQMRGVELTHKKIIQMRNKIKQINSLESDTIHPGNVLKLSEIPKRKSVVEAPTKDEYISAQSTLFSWDHINYYNQFAAYGRELPLKIMKCAAVGAGAGITAIRSGENVLEFPVRAIDKESSYPSHEIAMPFDGTVKVFFDQTEFKKGEPLVMIEKDRSVFENENEVLIERREAAGENLERAEIDYKNGRIGKFNYDRKVRDKSILDLEYKSGLEHSRALIKLPFPGRIESVRNGFNKKGRAFLSVVRSDITELALILPDEAIKKIKEGCCFDLEIRNKRVLYKKDYSIKGNVLYLCVKGAPDTEHTKILIHSPEKKRTLPENMLQAEIFEMKYLDEITVRAPFNGVVKKVSEETIVDEGEVLLELDDAVYEKKQKVWEKSVLIAKDVLREISSSNVDDGLSRLQRNAQQQIRRSERKMRIIRGYLRRSRVVNPQPCRGIIKNRAPLYKGMSVSKGDYFFTVCNHEYMQAVFLIDRIFSGKYKTGDELLVYLPGQDRYFPAKITGFDINVEGLIVEVIIKNLDGLLNENSKVKVYLPDAGEMIEGTKDKSLWVFNKKSLSKPGNSLFLPFPFFISFLYRKNRVKKSLRSPFFMALFFVLGLFGCSSKTEETNMFDFSQSSLPGEYEQDVVKEEFRLNKENVGQRVTEASGAVHIAQLDYKSAQQRCAEYFATGYKVGVSTGVNEDGNVSYSVGISRRKSGAETGLNMLGFDGVFGFTLSVMDNIAERWSGVRELKERTVKKTRQAAYHALRSRVEKKKLEAIECMYGIYSLSAKIEASSETASIVQAELLQKRSLFRNGLLEYSQLRASETEYENIRNEKLRVQATLRLHEEKMKRLLDIDSSQFCLDEVLLSEDIESMVSVGPAFYRKKAFQNNHVIKKESLIFSAQKDVYSAYERNPFDEAEMMLNFTSEQFSNRVHDVLDETEKGFFANLMLTKSFGKKEVIRRQRVKTLLNRARLHLKEEKQNIKEIVYQTYYQLQSEWKAYQLIEAGLKKAQKDREGLIRLIEKGLISEREKDVLDLDLYMVQQTGSLKASSARLLFLKEKLLLLSGTHESNNNNAEKVGRNTRLKSISFIFVFMFGIASFLGVSSLPVFALDSQSEEVRNFSSNASSTRGFKRISEIGQKRGYNRLSKLLSSPEVPQLFRIRACIELFECGEVEPILLFLSKRKSTGLDDDALSFFAAQLSVSFINKNPDVLFRSDANLQRDLNFLEELLSLDFNFFEGFVKRVLRRNIPQALLENNTGDIGKRTKILYFEEVIRFRVQEYLRKRNSSYAARGSRVIKKIFSSIGLMSMERHRKEAWLTAFLKNDEDGLIYILEREFPYIAKKVFPKGYKPAEKNIDIGKKNMHVNALIDYLSLYYSGIRNRPLMNDIGDEVKRLLLPGLAAVDDSYSKAEVFRVMKDGSLSDVLFLYKRLTEKDKQTLLPFIVLREDLFSPASVIGFGRMERDCLRQLFLDVLRISKKDFLKYYRLYLLSFQDFYSVKYFAVKDFSYIPEEVRAQADDLLKRRQATLHSLVFLDEEISRLEVDAKEAFTEKKRRDARFALYELKQRRRSLLRSFDLFEKEKSERFPVSGFAVLAGVVTLVSSFVLMKKKGKSFTRLFLTKPILEGLAKTGDSEWTSLLKSSRKWKSYFFIVLALKVTTTFVFTLVMMGVEEKSLFANLALLWIGLVFIEQAIDFVLEPIRERLGAVWLDDFASFLKLEVNKFKNVRGIDRSVMQTLYNDSFMLSTPYGMGKLGTLYIWESVMMPLAIMLVLPFVNLWFFIGYFVVIATVLWKFQGSLRKDDSIGKFNEAKELAKMDFVRDAQLRANLGISANERAEWNKSVEPAIAKVVREKRKYVFKLKLLAVLFPGTGALMGLPLSTLALSRGLQSFYFISEFAMSLSRAYQPEKKIYDFIKEILRFSGLSPQEKNVLAVTDAADYRKLLLRDFEVRVGRRSDEQVDTRPLILRASDLDLNFGEVIFIEGVSGSGKTTFLNAISRKDPTQISAGTMRVLCEKDRAEYLQEVKTGKGFAHYYTMEGLNDIYSYDELRKLIKGEDQKKRFAELVSQYLNVDIEKIAAYDYSDGQRARLIVAALMSSSDSPVMVLDQPFSWLDKETEEEWIGLIKEEARRLNKLVIIGAPSTMRENVFYDQEFYLSCGRLVAVQKGCERLSGYNKALEAVLKQFELYYGAFLEKDDCFIIDENVSEKAFSIDPKYLYPGNEVSVIERGLLPQLIAKRFPFDRFVSALNDDELHRSFVLYKERLQYARIYHEYKSSCRKVGGDGELLAEILVDSGVVDAQVDKMVGFCLSLFYAFDLFVENASPLPCFLSDLDHVLNHNNSDCVAGAGADRRCLGGMVDKEKICLNLFFSAELKKKSGFSMQINPFLSFLRSLGFQIKEVFSQEADLVCCLNREANQYAGAKHILSFSDEDVFAQAYLLSELLAFVIVNRKRVGLFDELPKYVIKEIGNPVILRFSKRLSSELTEMIVKSELGDYFSLAA